MDIGQFCNLVKEELKETAIITEETNFKELESYGSLSAVLILQLIENQFDVKLNPRGFRNINTINDLVEAIGSEKFN
ncbi:acyl carrier protein [Chryseobacterium wangxinyae]|uniref:acyl carrier protein n=1 Tax=Chryseobacterium sp. CY353 TaxID=2997334 RepID=UPI00227178BD|nr:acyl carrier protein [Chryseobacterium sp. CY353]MCY0969577.1 acyl carrier protein [Chryseobacterium sp. CY353]